MAAPLVVLAGVFAFLGGDGTEGGADPIPPDLLARAEAHRDDLSRSAIREAGRRKETFEDSALARVLREAGPDGPRILLRLIRDDDSPPGLITTCRSWLDPEHEPAGTWLAAHPDPRIDGELLALARDGDRHPEARRTAIIALCRPGHAAAMEPFADLALDPAESVDVRQAVLYRLHRIGVKPPPRLRDLLHIPFHGLERTAAAALGACGDAEAPSVLLEILARTPDVFGPDEDVHLAARAVVRLTGRGEEDARALVNAGGLSYSYTGKAGSAEQAAAKERAIAKKRKGMLAIHGRLINRLTDWLAEDPARRATDYERDGREYLDSGRRRRELGILDLSLAEISRRPDDGIDLAAAALVAYPEKRPVAERALEEIHRLAVLVRRDLGESPSPEAALAALARRLTPKRPLSTPTGMGPLLGSLRIVLDVGWGDDVGLSLLYLAVAERLGLPLHGVMAPGGMFVRFDDGETRLNAVPLEFGRTRTDVEIAGDLDPESLARGDLLRNLTKREVLGVALARASVLALSQEQQEWALGAADAAIRLRPAEAVAWQVRAFAGYHLTSVPDEQVLDDLRRAAELASRETGGSPATASVLEGLGRWREAGEEWKRILARSPEDLEARVRIAFCRLRLGESAGALADLAQVEAAHPDLARLRAAALAIAGDSAWREILAEVEAPEQDPRAHLDVATALLEGRDEHEPDPAAALDVLREVEPFAARSWAELTTFRAERFEDAERAAMEQTRWAEETGLNAETHADLRGRYFLLLGRATFLAGDRDQALRLLERAEEVGGPNRATRLFRRMFER